jgi:hypothetical protein
MGFRTALMTLEAEIRAVSFVALQVMMKPYGWILGCMLLLTACEKDINFKLDEATPKLVVEATIENGQPPMVLLSKSVGFFSKLSPQLLSQSFVHNADVFVSNGTLTHKLKEYEITVAPGISLYYYSIDSANLGTAFMGELSRDYSLRVVAEGQEYTAETRVPAITKQIDSMWSKPAPVADTARAIVMVRATDPPGFGDYVRIFVKINQQQFLPPHNSAFDDLFVDGTSYELQLTPGVDRNLDMERTNLFFKGDTVTLKVANIDKPTFTFWQTMEYSYASIGNPFSTPAKVIGNISNGALGHFSGYAAQFHTIIVK